MFICGMVLQCAGILKPGLSLDHYSRFDNHCHTYTCSYKLLSTNVKSIHSL